MILNSIKKKRNVSLPNEVEVHGVIVRKMPNGRYISALNTLEALPAEFTEEMKISNLSELFEAKNITTSIMKLLTLAPKFALKFLAELMEISEDKMFNELTPNETLEIFERFAKMNDLESFFQKMKSVSKMIKKSMTQTGFRKQ